MSNADGTGPETASTAPKASAKKSRNWLGVLLLLFVLGGAGAGAVYFGLPIVTERVENFEQRLAAIEASAVRDTDLRPDVNALEQDAARIEDRITRLETSASMQRAPEPDPRVDDVIARLDTLENAIPDNLTSRLANLENNNSEAMLARAASILALTELSRAASGIRPFTAELAVAAATTPGDEAVRALRPYAEDGAPMPAELSAEFPALAREALAAERNASGEGMFAQFWSRVRSFITIRRVGDVEGDDSAAKIARAEAALGNENLEGAVSEIASLEGPAAEHLAPWLAQAEARVAINNAVDSINAHIVQSLAEPNPESSIP